MKQIHICRNGNVTFEEVSIDVTENVFFTNLDPQEAHWPTLSSNQLGRAPSPNSSQSPVPVPSGNPKPPYTVTYKCKIPGHEKEQGAINVFAQLAAATTLKDATKGKEIDKQQVVLGGKSPYTITGELFQVTDATNNVIKSGPGIGPGLQLNPDQTPTSQGIWVTGIPTLSGTYNFTFTVDDAMGGNLQQVQYKMVVA